MYETRNKILNLINLNLTNIFPTTTFTKKNIENFISVPLSH